MSHNPAGMPKILRGLEASLQGAIPIEVFKKMKKIQIIIPIIDIYHQIIYALEKYEKGDRNVSYC